MKTSLSVLAPVYNEQHLVHASLERLKLGGKPANWKGSRSSSWRIARRMTLPTFSIGFEVELTVKPAKQHVRLFEVPISSSGRTYEEGARSHSGR